MPRDLTASRARDVVRLVVVGGVAVLLVGGYVTWRVWDQGGRDEQRPVDVIVVLGAAQYDGLPSPVFAARLDHAIGLWHAGIARGFVVTGGKLPGDRTTEGATARDYALARGVPDAAIFGEYEAHNTLESLRSVAALMRERGYARAVFVSDRTHMLRVLRMATDLGIEAYGSPTPTSPVERDPVERLQATVHEVGALVAYFLGASAPVVETHGG